jgi:hypothetical protein
MSTGTVSAAAWIAAKTAVNNLLNAFNAKLVTSYVGTISPTITLSGAQQLISRNVYEGDNVRYTDYSDADGLVTKYNLLRRYDSCRIYTASMTWEYNRTVCSADLEGRRDGSFSSTTPAYITPPAAGDIIGYTPTGNTDILNIIVAGTAIHNSTVLGVAPGAEYVYINGCHSNCHSSCHGSCNRSRR